MSTTTEEVDNLTKLKIAAIAIHEINNEDFFHYFGNLEVKSEDELSEAVAIVFNYRPVVYVRLLAGLSSRLNSSKMQELLKIAEDLPFDEYLSLIEAFRNSGKLTAKAQAYLDYLDCEEEDND
ncbi:MAG: hypothetical protein Q8P54_01580 [bacterium]|nr:hypothetical protein [bacterium]